MKWIWLVLVCFCLLFTACGEKQENTGEPETLPPLPEPIPQTELFPDETDYAAMLSAVFDDVEDAPLTDFAFEVQGKTATLTAYLGTAEAVRVPERVGDAVITRIADGVFANRSDLKILILPETIAEYGNDLLKDTALTALCAPYPQTLDYLGSLWGIAESIGNRAPIIKSLQYLKLLAPQTETEPFRLPANSLSDCLGLIALELPEGSELGGSALANCEKLAYLNAETLTSVGEKALDGCVSLQELKFSGSLTKMGFAALRGCRSLMKLELPFIGSSAEKQTGMPSERTDFLGFVFGAVKPAFAKGFYPPFLQKVTILEGCDELPDFALYECVSLTALSLPDSLKRIGGRALAGCTSLKVLSLPEGCAEIGDAACAGCTALITVYNLREQIKIGQNAFLNCPLK